MREIKFRMWNPKTKVMVDLHKITPLAVHPDLLKENLDGLYIPFKEDYPLMQFTGLCDKNGKEIYEGDIITTALPVYPFVDDNKPNYVGVVQWLFAGFEYVLQCVNPNKAGISNGINEPLQEGEPFLVVGNIYENPELIRQDG